MYSFSLPICFSHSCDHHQGGHPDDGSLSARAALSTAQRATSSVDVQQLMSSALLARSAEYCRASGFIGCCTAINVVRSPRAQH